MILTAENIVHYLLDKNLVSANTVVSSGFMVVDMSRRNRNFKILTKGKKGLFVKQVKNWDMQSVSSLKREATSYALAKTDSNFAELKELMPELVHYDIYRNILVLELFEESENLSEMHLRIGKFPTQIGASLGKSLGLYHFKVKQSLSAVRQKKIFPESLPWMLTINKNYLAQVKNIDDIHSDFFSVVEKYPQFISGIEKLRKSWQTNSLIHGDMKWDNCVVLKESQNHTGNQNIKIIDWELADLGDSSWDVGAIFQTYLSLWAMSVPSGKNLNTEQAISFSRYKINDMQPAIAEFWNSYSSTMQLIDKDAELIKCAECAAIRMIQTVYEQVHFTKQMTKNGVNLMQLSMNVLQNPKEAVNELLDLKVKK